ncbi:MAG: transposase [Prevotella sp.]
MISTARSWLDDAIAYPKIEKEKYLRKLKQETTYRIWKEKESVLHRIYWRERTFRTDGFFVSTIGNVCQDTVRHYIENQG